LASWAACSSVDAFLPDEMQLGVGVVRLELLQPPPRLANQVRVERAAQPAVRGDQQQCGATHARAAPRVARLAQQGKPLGQLRRVQLADHLGERLRVRARAHHAILGALQLRRGDELHRLGDLLRVLHRADAPLQLAGLRH